MEGKYQQPRAGASQPFFYRPSTIRFSLSQHASTLRDCSTKSYRLSSSGLVFSTTHPLVLMTALKPRFMNAMRSLPLVELTIARIPRTRALSATRVPSSSRHANSFSRISPLLPLLLHHHHLLFFARKSATIGFLSFVLQRTPRLEALRILDFHIHTFP